MITETKTNVGDRPAIAEIETGPDPIALSSDDIKALRTCDTVSFHARYDKGDVRTAYVKLRGAHILCKKECRSREVFSANRMEREIKCDRASLHGYSPNGWRAKPTAGRCFLMVHSCSVTSVWRTIVKLLRAGDRLELIWKYDCQSFKRYRGDPDSLVDAIHVDQFSIGVKRNKGAKCDYFEFLLDSRGVLNNTARDIEGITYTKNA